MLLPAAVAVAVTMVLLIGRVQRGRGYLPELLAFAVVVLAGQVIDAFLVPLYSLVKSWVDGAQRAELARLTSSVPTIGARRSIGVPNRVQTTSPFSCHAAPASARAASWAGRCSFKATTQIGATPGPATQDMRQHQPPVTSTRVSAPTIIPVALGGGGGVRA